MFVRSMFGPWSVTPYLSAGDSGGSGGGSSSSDNANAGGETGGTEGGAETATIITFPDEKAFMARVKRDSKAQAEARARELGFDSVAQMEDAVKAAKAQSDQQKTDLEKEREARQRIEAERDAVTTRANDRLIRAEVKSVAADLGVVDADAAYSLMNRDGVTVNDDGDVAGVKEALEALLTSKPYLKKSDGVPPRNSGDGFNGGAPPKSDDIKPGASRLRAAYAEKRS